MKFAGRSFKGLLVDLDGVLHVGSELIPGAVEFVARLRSKAIPHLFLTNTTTRSIRSLESKLVHMGFPIARESILSAPEAAKSYLKKHGINRCDLLLTEDVLEDFMEFRRVNSSVEAVVIGDIGDRWDYDLLNRVFREIDDGAEFIALHRNKYWKMEAGLQMDIGAFVAGLEYVTGREATIIGKPAPAFFEAALSRLGLSADSVAMIGDDIESDVGGAQGMGMAGVLVRTGKYREDAVRDSGVKPELIIDSIADFPI